MIKLNDLKPAQGSKHRKKRLGRGTGSELGKTCGRGHKGQHARSGGYHKQGFEGGQMPIQRRLPKFGFTSRIGLVTTEIRLSALNKVNAEVITLETLKQAGLVRKNMKRAKVFLAGTIDKAINLKGLLVTKGAKAAIEQAGGTVEE